MPRKAGIGRAGTSGRVKVRVRARTGTWTRTARVGHRARRVIAMGASTLLVASTASACFAEPSVLPTVRDFLIAWQVGNYAAAAGHTTGGDRAKVRASLAQLHDQLDAASLKLRMGQISKQGNEAVAQFEVKVDLGENGEPWDYLGRMNLRRINGNWKVIWSPSIVHPNLTEGDRLAIVSETPQRAPIQASGGHPLLQTVRADIVGVYPGSLRDPNRTITQLARILKLDSERLVGRVRSAPPRTFLPLVTLQWPDRNALSAQLRQVEGLQSRPVNAPIAPRTARELVGMLGPATSVRLQEVGAPYQPGDTIGVSGLQLLYQRRLAGIPTVKVVIVDAMGRMQVLREWEGRPSAPVTTTLKPKVQAKAEAVLRRLSVPASMVVVHQATGQILAVANHRTGNQNLAMQGSYPPGMVFGIVSAEALLKAGQKVNSPTDCPATITVGGQTITNAGPARGKSSFQMNFANSCTTTLAGLGSKVDTDTLMHEVDRLGIGKDWGLPVPAFSGYVPRPADEAGKANVMIGQSGVRVSPLAMALVAGATDSGTWRPPALLKEPDVPQKVQPQSLDVDPLTGLRMLMQQSVHSGTARAAALPVTPRVHGVTSTVDYIEGGRSKTVSWFVGFQGDLAFAIAIEGRVSAAGIARMFLRGA